MGHSDSQIHIEFYIYDKKIYNKKGYKKIHNYMINGPKCSIKVIHKIINNVFHYNIINIKNYL